MFEFILALILVIGVAGLVITPFFAPDILLLLFAPLVPLAIVLALVAYPKLKNFSYRRRRITPDRITGYQPRKFSEVTPEELSATIVERAGAIKRAIPEEPSEIQLEMYAIGYRACVNDMITLTQTTNEALREANFLRRLKLRRAYRKATGALSTTRDALPPGALKAARQEQQ